MIKKGSIIIGIAVLSAMLTLGTAFADAPDQQIYSGDEYQGKLWVSQKPFQPYPTEEQLFSEPCGPAAGNRNPAILLNGKPFQNTAELRDGSLFLPLRAVCEALGFEVQWSGRDNTVTAARGDRNILLDLTAPSIDVDGGKVSLEGKYIAIDGSTYMEEGFFSGYLGIRTKRDEASRTVTLLPEPIPLHFAPAENNQDVRMEQKAQIGGMMGGDMAYVEGITAYMYTKADDSEDLHGGYGGKDGPYDLGPVGSILNSDNGLNCVRALQLYGKTLIKFQGVFGSHVLRTNYFAIEEGVPKPFLSVDGLTAEMDINGDGKKEIVAELSGTIPSVSIFEWDGKSLLASSVDKALGADSVEFNHEDGSFRAYYKTNARDNPEEIAYRYAGNGLELKKADRDAGDVLSENVIDYNGDSSDEKIIIKMTEGEQYEDEAAGPFMGWNWQGKFVVQLTDAKGEVLSEIGLNKIFDPDGADMVFNRTFLIQFGDYNNDGSPDFVIGQYGSGNGNVYRLFTVKNGKIEPLPVENGESGGLFSSGGRSRYTREFDKFAKSGFINWYYNNALGKNIRQYFTWDGAQFVIKPGGE